MVYILLGTGFEEIEALATADVLRRGGVDVTLTGIGAPAVAGGHGIVVTADRMVEDVTLAAGDTVVLPGGLGGVESIEGSAAAMELVRQAGGDETVYLAAICAAPTLLARAGILGPGDDAVCYPGMEEEMTRVGVTAHMDASVILDGKLITGRGPGSAIDFGLALLEVLKGEETAEQVRGGMYYPA